EEYRYKSDTVTLLKLENVDSEEAAREFVNRDVYYPLDAVDGDLVGDMTWDSFIGYTVTDQQHGDLGVITDVDESTLNVLLQIDHDGEELLIPAVEEFILDVDHDKKHLTVSIPKGLLEL
ncbi:MAG: 16S rRNA processing protein RimM, partial [Tannerellaceae bacterium]